MRRNHGQLAAVLLVGVMALGAVAIYPDDLWDRSHKMTVANFDDIVKKEVDAGKTLFAPSWNAVTALYENNPNIAFGDVNLSEEPVRGNHNPGAGGWPTVKYFNKATGYEGKAYEKKTSKSMCDELGDEAMLQAYFEEAGGVSLCDAETAEGCSEKEAKFISTMKGRLEDVPKQLARLSAMTDSKMKPDLAKWIKQRIAILKQLSQKEEL